MMSRGDERAYETRSGTNISKCTRGPRAVKKAKRTWQNISSHVWGTMQVLPLTKGLGENMNTREKGT